MPLLPWDLVEEGVPDRRRVFTVRSDVVRSQKTGKSMTVDRLIAADWVNVVCVTTSKELVLVRQGRHGARAFTLELPAGLVERDEPALLAGQRELREETGYTGDARVIGQVCPNPAFMFNVCTTLLVENATQTHPQELDPTEDVEVVKFPVTAVDDLVRNGDLQNALTLAALTYWRL